MAIMIVWEIKKFVPRGISGGWGIKPSLYAVAGGVSRKFISKLFLLDFTIPLGIFETSLSLSLSLLFWNLLSSSWAIRLEFSAGLFPPYISEGDLGGVPLSPPPPPLPPPQHPPIPPLPPPALSSSLLMISSSPSLNSSNLFSNLLFHLALKVFSLTYCQLIYST